MGKFYLQNRDNMFSSNEDNEHLQYIGRWKNRRIPWLGYLFLVTGTEAGNYYNGEFRHGLKHGFGFYSNKNEDKPLECIYFNDKRLAQWSDLYEGRRIKVRFASFSGVGTDWYEGTIIKFDPTRAKCKNTKPIARNRASLNIFVYMALPGC